MWATGEGLRPLARFLFDPMNRARSSPASGSSSVSTTSSTSNLRAPDSQIGLHECRHSAKSMMREAGIPEEYVDSHMGHSRDGVSARYWHAAPTHLTDNGMLCDDYYARVTGAQRVLEPVKPAA